MITMPTPATAIIVPPTHMPVTADGGVFVAGSLAWGMIFDGFRPDRWDIAGSAICLAMNLFPTFSPSSTSYAWRWRS